MSYRLNFCGIAVQPKEPQTKCVDVHVAIRDVKAKIETGVSYLIMDFVFGRYVSRKDMDTNAVYISKEYYSAVKLRNEFYCGEFNWMHGQPPSHCSQLMCKVRHGPTLYRFATLCAF
jgi:hypothetical protein